MNIFFKQLNGYIPSASNLHLFNKNGSLDMIYKINRQFIASGMNADNSLDMRLKINRQHLPFGTNIDGSLDMRLKENSKHLNIEKQTCLQ